VISGDWSESAHRHGLRANDKQAIGDADDLLLKRMPGAVCNRWLVGTSCARWCFAVRVLAAFDKAVPGAGPDDTPVDLLKHLAMAGKLARNKNYEDAASELTDALQSDDGTATAFVMGAVLTAQEQYVIAGKVYREILERNPDFPEAHTKLSFALYKNEQKDESLSEAKAALVDCPENAEAYKNVGNALLLAHKFDAAIAEFREALRIKPDYAPARYDVGYALDLKGDRAGAIAEYRKALVLDPTNVKVRYDLGTDLMDTDECAAAIPELREAKRLDPSRFDIRMNLGVALYRCWNYSQAQKEFRELVGLFPDSSMAHARLGNAYYANRNEPAAEKEYRTAAELDPSDAEPLLRLGELMEQQKRYDEAFVTFGQAAKADDKSGEAHKDVARYLVLKKDYVAALRECRRAEELNPGDASTHDLYARALLAAGESNVGIDEFKQAVALDPTDVQTQLRLAGALEKKGDWVAAMEQYRKAAISGAANASTPRIVRESERDAQKEFKDAEACFQKHLDSLKKAGEADEAAKLEATVNGAERNGSQSAKLDSAMQAGYAAIHEGKLNDALQSYKQAVAIAENLKMKDWRLAVALGEFGKITGELGRFDEANAIFQRQLKVCEEMAGAGSPQMIGPLQNLA
jgi:tetratricopeptide (TPR) repeat protein